VLGKYKTLELDFPHFESRGTIYSYFNFSLKPAVVSCLTNALAPLPICARELFKGSNESDSLLDCTRKKIFL